MREHRPGELLAYAAQVIASHVATQGGMCLICTAEAGKRVAWPCALYEIARTTEKMFTPAEEPRRDPDSASPWAHEAPRQP